MIREDIRSGTIPATVPNFAVLQSQLDVNGYFESAGCRCPGGQPLAIRPGYTPYGPGPTMASFQSDLDLRASFFERFDDAIP